MKKRTDVMWARGWGALISGRNKMLNKAYKKYFDKRAQLEDCLESLSQPHANDQHKLLREDVIIMLKGLAERESDLRQLDPTYIPDPIADGLRKKASELLAK